MTTGPMREHRLGRLITSEDPQARRPAIAPVTLMIGRGVHLATSPHPSAMRPLIPAATTEGVTMPTTMTASHNQMTDSQPEQIASRWFAALWQAEVKNHAASHATLLGWLIGLPAGLDPAAAATAVLDYQGRQEAPALSAALTTLLRQVAACPAVRLARSSASRRSMLRH